MKPLIVLPKRGGVANDMGDFFVPDDCREKIMVASGKCKSRSYGETEIVMAAFCPAGNMRLLVAQQLPSGEWIAEKHMLSSDVESDQIRAQVKAMTGKYF